MLTRDQGQRRIRSVTIGLAAASVAGTLAVGVTAHAKESAKDGAEPAPTPTGTPAPGATASPAAPPPAPTATAELPGPDGPVTEDDGPGQATSGGS